MPENMDTFIALKHFYTGALVTLGGLFVTGIITIWRRISKVVKEACSEEKMQTYVDVKIEETRGKLKEAQNELREHIEKLGSTIDTRLDRVDSRLDSIIASLIQSKK
jgi:hypothetical protein